MMIKVQAVYDKEQGKRFFYRDKVSEHGKTRILIECPFCHTRFWGYVWSIKGSGKKCVACGALHTGKGIAHPVIGEISGE